VPGSETIRDGSFPQPRITIIDVHYKCYSDTDTCRLIPRVDADGSLNRKLNAVKRDGNGRLDSE